MNPPSKLPVHVVAGPLGVGKTTAILSYVERQAGREMIAVLVNDFGPIGMDGSIMEGSIGRVVGDQMKVLTIPGGCLCCASADALATGVPRLAAIEGVTRIIIEPSGIAMPAQVVDVVRGLADMHGLEVRPTIVMLDAGEFRSHAAEHMPYYQRLVESADVLVANRCDKADAAAVQRFRDWANALYPPKLEVITTTMGELPDRVFAAHARATHAPRHDTHVHHHETHDADTARTGGRVWESTVMFDVRAVRAAVAACAAERFKGIFHTPAGWKLLELARDQWHERSTEHRRDSRADWIMPANRADAAGQLGPRLEACRIDQR